MLNVLNALAEKWAKEAESWRGIGHDKGATVLDRARGELLGAVEEASNALLNLTEAAKESGYHPGHLGRLVREGKLQNYGTKMRPRVRRGDLPRKPQACAKPLLYASVAGTRMETALSALANS